MTRTRAALAALVAAVWLVGGAALVVGQSAPGPATTVGVPDRVNEYASVASEGAWVALAWAASSDATGTNVYAAVSRDGGASFGTPVRVNAVEKQASVNGEQPPRIAFIPGDRVRGSGSPAIVVVWTAKAAAGTALLSARSGDGGRSFGPSTPVPGSEAAGNRGWESIAVDHATGRVYVVWLDHRDTAAQADGAHAMHQHGAAAAAAATPSGDGAARAQRSQLFVGSLGADAAVHGIARGVCYCCKTAATMGADGAVYVAWRHVYAGNQRDIAFATSRDHGRSFTDPQRVSQDAWQLDGCPENGPSLAVGSGGRVFVLWPTLVKAAAGETLRLFLSSTTDGARFTPRAPLPAAGAAYHPQLVTAADGTLIAAWDEVVTGAPRRVRLARGRPDGSGQARFDLIDVGPDADGSYPVVTVTPNHVVMAWTMRGASPKPIRVRRFPL
jgi:hypothetical protein